MRCGPGRHQAVKQTGRPDGFGRDSVMVVARPTRWDGARSVNGDRFRVIWLPREGQDGVELARG